MTTGHRRDPSVSVEDNLRLFPLATGGVVESRKEYLLQTIVRYRSRCYTRPLVESPA